MRKQIEEYLKGTLTQAERAQLVDKVRSSDELDCWFRSQIEHAEGDMPQDAKDRVWQRVCQAQQPTRTVKNGRRMLWYYVAAACVAVVVVLAATWNDWKLALPIQPVNTMGQLTVQTGAGERSRVTLPDGTQVTLNTMSRITYDCAMLNGKRSVLVEGEAYFDVAKDTEHPFVIGVNEMEVTCLGTALNVRNYQDEQTASVVLVNGKVRVTTSNGDLTMEPNSRVECDKRTLQMSKTSVVASNYTCWLKGETRYNDQSLADITRELARNYHIKIIITNDELSKQRFTGYLGACSLKNVLDILTITSDLAYQIDGDSVYIYARR